MVYQNTETTYRVYLYNSSGTKVADLSGYPSSITLGYTRNRPSTCRLTFEARRLEDLARSVNTALQSLLAVGVAEIRVYRLTNHIFTGQIVEAPLALTSDGAGLEVQCLDVLGLLKQRFVTAIYATTDAGAIAQDLINDTQALTNGDYGITIGTINTSSSISREYKSKSILDAITNLAEEGYGDFELTPGKIFNWRYPRLGTRTVRFEYPRNIKQVTVVRSSADMANYITLRGQGNGVEQLTASVTNAVAAAVYKRREAIVDMPDAQETAKLTASGNQLLAVRSLPIVVAQVSLLPNQDGTQPVPFADFGIDDSFTVKTDDPYISDVVNNVYRIEGIGIQVNAEGMESVTINQGEKTIKAPTDVYLPPPPPPPPYIETHPEDDRPGPAAPPNPPGPRAPGQTPPAPPLAEGLPSGTGDTWG